MPLKREEEQERRREEAEKLEAEEKARKAKRPRHQDLDISTLGENMEPEDLSTLSTAMEVVLNSKYPRRVSSHDAFVFDTDTEEEAEVKELRSRLQKLKVVSRAKVTQNRVYSAAFHPEVTKDLIFFGGEPRRQFIIRLDLRRPTFRQTRGARNLGCTRYTR